MDCEHSKYYKAELQEVYENIKYINAEVNNYENFIKSLLSYLNSYPNIHLFIFVKMLIISIYFNLFYLL